MTDYRHHPAPKPEEADAACGPSVGEGCAAGAAAPRRAGGPWRVVFIAAIVVFGLAVAALAAIGVSYLMGQRTYEQIAETGFQPNEADTLEDMQVDWDALRAINPDVVGWLYIPNTSINYPIVQADDDEYYLTHDFKGSEGWLATFGAIFLSAGNAADFSDPNNIVYGHHLNDGSMFAPIAALGDPDAFNATRRIYVLTPKGNYELTTFSIMHVDADDPLVQTGFADDARRMQYMQDKIDRSEVAVPDAPAASSIKHAFAFATCDNLLTDGRWVLFSYVSRATAGAPGAQAASNGPANPDDVAAVGNAAKELAQ